MKEQASSNITVTPPATTPQNLTTTEAAAYLNIKPATLEQWRWRGEGPRFVKLSRSVRYRLADLESFLEGRVYRSTSEAQAAEV